MSQSKKKEAGITVNIDTVAMSRLAVKAAVDRELKESLAREAHRFVKEQLKPIREKLIKDLRGRLMKDLEKAVRTSFEQQWKLILRNIDVNIDAGNY